MSTTPQGPTGDQGPYQPPSYGSDPNQQPTPQQPADPYGQQAQPQQPADPYGQQAQPQQPADPYGQQAQNPYGQAASPQAANQPSGAWASQPYGQGGQYGQQAPQYASWGKRALGWLLDYLVPGIVFGLIGNMVFPPMQVDPDTFVTTGGTPLWYSIVTSLILYLALSAYSAKTGQTWGRKLAKTQLLGEDGKPIGLGRSFIRYIAHIIDSIILMIGWLFPLWDSKRQTIADKLMKTYVIDVSTTGPINVQN